jgi:Aspartyl/Asparaginyl beta-hydroxylase
MKIITNSETAWSNIILNEITKDDDWWRPVADNHQIFEQCYMKFVNGNLNYYSFRNMLLALIEGYEFNNTLPRTLEFCNYVRTLTMDQGPFGRMCVWNIPPRAELLLHKDSFRYHHNIIRNIFIISDHDTNNARIEINKDLVEFNQGTLFQFNPARESHSFKNNSDDTWYFLGFDFWIPNMLLDSYNRVNLTELFNDPIRQSNKHGSEVNCKYMSNN